MRTMSALPILKKFMNDPIRGTIANKGKVRGRARIVNSSKDFKKFVEGDILIADLTSPAYSPVIMKAAAIVTNKGGITSHPAIIAREFNIPCIVGTKNATKLIKNDDLIEVDANKGIITIIKII